MRAARCGFGLGSSAEASNSGCMYVYGGAIAQEDLGVQQRGDLAANLLAKSQILAKGIGGIIEVYNTFRAPKFEKSVTKILKIHQQRA